MMWLMTDSVSSCCCVSYWKKWEEGRNRNKWKRNFKQRSGRRFYFYLSTFPHSDNKQTMPPEGPCPDPHHWPGSMLKSWRSWHGVLNTHHCFPRAFLFVSYLTGEQAGTKHRLPWQHPGIPQRSSTLGLPAQHSHLVRKMRWYLISAATIC